MHAHHRLVVVLLSNIFQMLVRLFIGIPLFVQHLFVLIALADDILKELPQLSTLFINADRPYVAAFIVTVVIYQKFKFVVYGLCFWRNIAIAHICWHEIHNRRQNIFHLFLFFRSAMITSTSTMILHTVKSTDVVKRKRFLVIRLENCIGLNFFVFTGTRTTSKLWVVMFLRTRVAQSYYSLRFIL